jgi:hypothetical protein
LICSFNFLIFLALCLNISTVINIKILTNSNQQTQSYEFTSRIAAFLSVVLITEMLEICIQTSYDQSMQLILKSYLPVVYGTSLSNPYTFCLHVLCYNLGHSSYHTVEICLHTVFWLDILEIQKWHWKNTYMYFHTIYDNLKKDGIQTESVNTSSMNIMVSFIYVYWYKTHSFLYAPWGTRRFSYRWHDRQDMENIRTRMY